jgi:hypothetical protein
MENSTHQHDHFHISESLRNAIIFILIFGLIATISYFEWQGKF